MDQRLPSGHRDIVRVELKPRHTVACVAGHRGAADRCNVAGRFPEFEHSTNHPHGDRPRDVPISRSATRPEKRGRRQLALRLLGPIGDIPPVEAEAEFYATISEPAKAA